MLERLSRSLAAAPSPWTPRRPAPLRYHFFFVVLVALVPLLLFAVVTVALFADNEADAVQRGGSRRTLALLTAVDAELGRTIAALQSLAASSAIESRDLPRLREEAARVLESRPEWLAVQVLDRTGERPVDLRQPYAAELDFDLEDEESWERVLRDGVPTIGNLRRERNSGAYLFAVRVPCGPKDSLILTALVRPSSLTRLLDMQQLPPEWVAVVLDRHGVIVARTVSEAQYRGQPAAPRLREESSRSESGQFHGQTLEGQPVYTPFHRSRDSGWTVAMGIPAAVLDAPFRRSVAYLLSFGVASAFLGLLLAWLVSRQPARAIEALAGMADELGSGSEPVEAPAPTAVAEVERLRAAFEHAAALLHARSVERDTVEGSLREAEAALRETGRHKDQFLAMLGHELRNPLGIISTAVQLLRARAPSDATTAELQEMMDRQVAHMTRLLDDLLDVSRIAQGRIQVKKAHCDLARLVRETAEDHRGALEQAGLSLRIDVPPRPLWVMCDRTRLAQAVANLLHNAQKFTDRGGMVTVALHDHEDHAELKVRDTGFGMDAETLASAFQPFSQGDRTIDRSRGGLGLGLALVRGLVELHGGIVEASSEGIGLGAEFTVRLPIAPIAVFPDDTEAPIRNIGKLRKILVIEDNQFAARTMQMLLVDAGHEVEVAHSGPAGVAAAERFRPDVVLCDIGLPGLTGYEVARALREMEPLRETVLVAVTGYGQDEDRDRARDAGFDEHMTKPVDVRELHRLLAGTGV